MLNIQGEPSGPFLLLSSSNSFRSSLPCHSPFQALHRILLASSFVHLILRLSCKRFWQTQNHLAIIKRKLKEVSNPNTPHPSSELWGPWEIANQPTQSLVDQSGHTEQEQQIDPQFSHREHVTSPLLIHPTEAPLFHPYMWHAPQPKRDDYVLAMAIISVVGSGLVLLMGLGITVLFLLTAVLPHTTLGPRDQLNTIVLAIIAIGIGIFGGAFGLYHSIRALMQKPSTAFSLPRFWIFLILYAIVIASGFVLLSRGQEVAFPALTVALIVLAGALPALAVTALGVRRLRTRTAKKVEWPTSWRRFSLALTSGATLGIGLASILEVASLAALVSLTHIQGIQHLTACIDTPDAQSCQNPAAYSLLLFIVAVVAPLVEETVKPLAVVIFIGRLHSAAEAFMLGMACGIGFDLVETSLYISSGYHDWLATALLRTGAGLLHGFGAAMVALGWYYLTHAKKHRWLLAFACWSYAILQHAIWNGSVGIALLPAPIGPLLDSWNLNLGFTSLPFYTLINIIELLFMVAFFIYITGKLRAKTASPLLPSVESNVQTVQSSVLKY